MFKYINTLSSIMPLSISGLLCNFLNFQSPLRAFLVGPWAVFLPLAMIEQEECVQIHLQT